MEPKDNRIAIIGLSAILPGGENVNECWETIRAGLDKIQELPADRLDVTAYYNPDKTAKDKIYCKQGGFIPDFDFDAREFGMNMFQVEDADTNQTLTLLKVKEALEDAGVQPFTAEKKHIGVVLGIGGGQKASNEFYSRMNYVVVDKVLRKMGLPDADVDVAVEKFKANFPEWRLDSFPGFLGNVTAGRCTNVFNLDGMNCVVDAACASSLIALKVATDELLHGDCDEMICGATCTDNSIGMFMAFSKTPVFSTDSHLTAYDENTKGMLIGEGSVMLLLKRYADAVRDGDQIHAVIRGVASSSDGKASGIYSPTIDGQQQAIERAYKKANVDPATITLVEGHGTGTPVGDRIELTALKNFFQQHITDKEQIGVGSIKSQIGHLKAVAGFAGMVKVIMGLKHKILPASINVKNPPLLYDNTKIQDSPLYINTGMRPWFPMNNYPRRAGISSFGFGGANYHCVIEEAEPEHAKPYRVHELPIPVVISAPSPEMLIQAIEKELSLFEKAELGYPAYKEFCSKYRIRSIKQSDARLGFVASSAGQVVDNLKSCLEKTRKELGTEKWTLLRQNCHYRRTGIATKNQVAALFSGQGSQYVNMFSDVAMNWPNFREVVTKMDTASQKICGVQASKVMYPRKPYETEKPLDNTEISTVLNAQITTVACSLGSYNIFKSAGFKPDFVAGHSLGEFCSLCAAGLIDETEACEIVCHRAKIMGSNEAKNGAMIAVIGEGAEKVKISSQNVWVANKNCPSQLVLTGDVPNIEKETALLDNKFKVVRLNCSDAFHSPFMKSANDKFVKELSNIKFKKVSSVKPFSNVTGSAYGESDPKTLLQKHMMSSVLFDTEVHEMYKAGARVFVEFGPRNTLTKLVENILKEKPDVFTFAVNDTSKQDSESQLRDCAMKMSVLGVQLENFDPWPVENKFKLKQAQKKKTQLRLSASTYVSAKTLKEREAIMNDGRIVSLLKNSTNTQPAQSFVADKQKAMALENELSNLKTEKKKLTDKLQLATREIEELRTKMDAIQTNTSQRSDGVEVEAIRKHRQMIISMLNEYDKMIDTMSDAGNRSDFESKIPDLPRRDEVQFLKPTVVDNSLLQKAESVVLKVLSEKTGYDLDMIESDMELETELGIDSIKRVEILSEVQSILNIEAKDVDALSRTKTVGEVINAMKFEISCSAQIDSSKPVVTKSYTSSASSSLVSRETPEVFNKLPSGSKSTAGLLNKAENVVMQVLAEKTGYEIEMIENDMELETELGIDSIKRVEILSAVQSMLNIEAKNVDALSRTRTVGEVIEAMKSEIKLVGAELNVPSKVVLPTPSKNVSPVVTEAAKIVVNDLVQTAEKVVLQVLAEKTGYDSDMIESDMELETELGIDSIKRVEILSEVQNKLNIEAKNVDALSRTKTVGEVIEAMKNEIRANTSAINTAPATVSSTPKIASSLPSQAPTDSLKKAEATVLKVLAEKTGYDIDMIEHDMELETELGIDSIKRVEILSEVQNLLSIEAKNVDALSRTKTVGEVIQAMKNEIGAQRPATPVSTPLILPVSLPTSSSTNAAVNRASDVVLKVLAEKTGYEVEMIEPDMELETELGIDSIKRVEILSEVQNLLNIEAKNVDALSRTKTVGEVIEAMKIELGSTVTVPTIVKTVVSAVAPSVKAAPKSSELVFKAESVVLKVLADKTGYDVDMIEEDMELETELGIDSIKRVEILSEVQNMLNIEAKNVDALSRTKTVGEVIQAMKNEIDSTSIVKESPPVEKKSKTVTAVQPANSASVKVGLLDNAEKVVLKVLAEKTGYEVEMIEQDMELETELGIDSIKRVEILSEVQSLLGIEAKNVDALSRTRTVGEVIQAMKSEINGSSSGVPEVKSSTIEPVRSAVLNDSNSLEIAQTVVLQVLAEKTGYEVDMIEQDMELETELGIDSIKRVEILSEVQNKLNIEAKNVDALSRTRTVGEVIAAMKNEIGQSAPVSTSNNSALTASQSVSISSESLTKAEEIVLKVLSEKTGYEIDMIEKDMELETELGIDSIKRVEILSEVQGLLNIEAKNIDALSRTRTVGEVISAMMMELGSIGSPEKVSKVPMASKQPFETTIFDYNNTLIRDQQSSNLSLSYPELIDLDSPLSDQKFKIGKVVLCGGDPSLCKALSIDLETTVTPLKNDGGETEIKTSLESVSNFTTLIYIHGSEPISNCLLVAKYARKHYSASSQKSFLVVVSGDGMLGYSGNFKSIGEVEMYALCGLVKTIALEWPEIQTKIIDISSSITKTEYSKVVASELRDTNKMVKEIGYPVIDRRVGVTVRGLVSKASSISNSKDISENDVWVVTGGARGITPLCIREIAKLVQGGTYYLLGRSQQKAIPDWAKSIAEPTEKTLQAAAIAHIKSTGEKPKPMVLRAMVSDVLATLEVEDNLRQINSYCNGKAKYLSCDINDIESVRKTLNSIQSTHKITAVFHASGVLRDKLIENKSLQDFQAVYDTKVRGFDNVWSALDTKQIRHVILFSSLAGFYGNAGQSDYSMANEVLNKLSYFIHAKSNNKTVVKAFDFGPWDGGMVTPELKKHFIENNVQIIDRDSGAISVASMSLNCEQKQILVGNWGLAAQTPAETTNEFLFRIRQKDFYADHAIHGKAVVPFTFNLATMSKTLLGIYPGYYVKSIKDIKLFRGVSFSSLSGTEEIECKLIIDQISAVNPVDSTLEVKVNLHQKTPAGKYAPSYQAMFTLTSKILAINISPSTLTLPNNLDLEKQDVYNGKILFHGPKFQAIKQVRHNNSSILAKVDISSPEFCGVPAEALVLDVVFQAALVLANKVTSKAALPTSIEHIELSSSFMDGSKSFKNTYVLLTRNNNEKDATWHFDFKIQDNSVVASGSASITLNDTLQF